MKKELFVSQCYICSFRLILFSEHPVPGAAPSPSHVFTCFFLCSEGLAGGTFTVLCLLNSATSLISGCLLDEGGSRGHVSQVTL